MSAASFGQWVDFDSARVHQDEFDWQVERIDPSPPQREAMEIAYARYAEEYDAAKATYLALNKWIWSNGESDRWYGGRPREEFGNEVWRESRMNQRNWEDVWREIEGRYFGRLATIAVGHEESLEAMKRKRFRFREFNDTSGYWETGWEIDLIQITENVSMAMRDSPEVAKVLHEYELALHRVLLEIDAFRRVRDEKYHQLNDELKSLRAAGVDVTALLAERRRWGVRGSAMSLALRSLQQETASRLLTAAASSPDGPQLEDAVHAELWSMLKPEHGVMPETAFDEALGQHDLSTSQHQQVVTLRDAYRGRRRSEFARVGADYLARFAPALTEESSRLADAGDYDGANAIHRPSRERWEQFQAQWQSECERTIAQLKAILAEPAGETAP